jgi:hypothetical protein
VGNIGIEAAQFLNGEEDLIERNGPYVVIGVGGGDRFIHAVLWSWGHAFDVECSGRCPPPSPEVVGPGRDNGLLAVVAVGVVSIIDLCYGVRPPEDSECATVFSPP